MATQTLGRILVVDDEIELASILCEMLQQQGYEALSFNNGKDALKALKKNDFDLLLTDLMMPDMDGITLLNAGLEIDPNLVGIIMTGQGTVRTAVDAMKTGAFDYILKPFKANIILATLSRAMAVRKLKEENIELRGTIAIYELTKAVAFTMDPNLIAGKVADAALEQCRADEVSIMLPTEKGDELYVAAVRGKGRDHILGERVKINQGIAGWVANRHEFLKLEGKVDDERFKPVHPRPEINAAISVPMMAGGKFVGVVNINAIYRHSFTPGQIKALTITVSLGAPSLENAWLFKQVYLAEEKYRSIFDNATEGIFQITPEGRFLSANNAIARMYGYESPEELIGSFTDMGQQLYVNPDDCSRFKKLIEESGSVESFEAQVRRKDNTKIWVSINSHAVRDHDDKVLYFEGTNEDITPRKLAEESLQQTLEKLRKSLASTIQAMSLTVETRDPYTAGHQRRVSTLAKVIAQEMGLSDDTVDNIRMAGIIHDIGKISVPVELLVKPTRLTDIELSLIRVHAQSGYDILKDVELPYPIAEIVLQHHERLDGSGYPQGLKGDKILLEAKIICVADVTEAIASHRPYRPARGIDAALEEIEKNKGILYDAEVVEVCLKLFREGEFEFELTEYIADLRLPNSDLGIANRK
jgi:PAS domain S-box-containing protein